MTWDEATDALLVFFEAQWSALHPAVPLHHPNAKPVPASSASGAWARIRILPTFSNAISVGTFPPVREQGGRVVVNTFTPIAKGDGVATGYQRDIESIWEQSKTNGLTGDLHLRAPEPVPQIEDPQIPAWVGGCSIAFTFTHQP